MSESAERIKKQCADLRETALDLEKASRRIASECFFIPVETAPRIANGFDAKEAGAQAMLAVRHLEDARMRLGKVMQYLRDGVSSYDKEQLP